MLWKEELKNKRKRVNTLGKNIKHVIIIGGGAAGMMAAISAATCGHKVTLYEKNEKLGKKLYITGKGRCNITNACDMEELFSSMVSNDKFMYSSFYTFTNQDMIERIEEWGCPIKIERGNRVFPVSDKSNDVIQALARKMKELKVTVNLFEEVAKLLVKDEKIHGILLKKGNREVNADAVIVATGGLSYPTTGSTGDGYEFAKEVGHTIKDASPGLVPFEVLEEEGKQLQGLSLRNISVKIKKGNKNLYEDFGEMLFTHFGVSGPVLISASSYVSSQLRKQPLVLEIDLKPALSKEQLDARILRDFEKAKNKQFRNSLSELLPSKMIPILIERTGIDPEKKIHEITKQERLRLGEVMKGFTFTLTNLRGFKEAIITQGGIAVNEINPSTMESKKVKDLYFVGEVLDLDAVTGGYNLQIAWSTGYLAGISIG